METSIAKGMMQLWRVPGRMLQSSLPDCLPMGNQCRSGYAIFKRLKGMLESVDMFNYPRFCRKLPLRLRCLEAGNYMVSRMKTPLIGFTENYLPVNYLRCFTRGLIDFEYQ